MQSDRITDQIRRQEITLNKLPDQKNADHLGNRHPGIKLSKRDGQTDNKTKNRTDIGNKRNNAGNKPDQYTKIQADQIKTDRIKCAEQNTDRKLPADE